VIENAIVPIVELITLEIGMPLIIYSKRSIEISSIDIKKFLWQPGNVKGIGN